jgi:BT1 family protein
MRPSTKATATTDEIGRISSSQAPSAIGFRQYAMLVGAGAFATTFAQSRILGQFPTTFLLKEYFHLPRENVALFFFWATFPWNVKPLAGILTDAFPLFGTRRRHYMMLGATAAGFLWILMGVFSHVYAWLLFFSIGMNVATVFASTVMGGLMVEAGQAFGASGRMSSLRQVVQSVASIIAPAIGGYLATKAFGWTTGIGAATILSLAVCTFLVLRERPVPHVTTAARTTDMRGGRDLPVVGMITGVLVTALLASGLLRIPELRNVAYSLYALVFVFVLIVAIAVVPTSNPVIAGAQTQLSQIFRSRTLWLAVGMLFLVYTVPGFNTALIYQQSDVLKFSKSLIGLLGSLEGVFGVAAAAFYAVFCRKVNLRVLLVNSIGLNGLATLLYLVYTASTAPFVHSIGGFVGILSELALMDLAIRSTPAGCEALGFALMMSVRNFGIAMSDVIGSQLLDQFHVSFNALVVVNALTTLVVLVFVPLLPRIIVSRREGETLA